MTALVRDVNRGRFTSLERSAILLVALVLAILVVVGLPIGQIRNGDSGLLVKGAEVILDDALTGGGGAAFVAQALDTLSKFFLVAVSRQRFGKDLQLQT